jgi:hypothetical protein
VKYKGGSREPVCDLHKPTTEFSIIDRLTFRHVLGISPAQAGDKETAPRYRRE